MFRGNLLLSSSTVRQFKKKEDGPIGCSKRSVTNLFLIRMFFKYGNVKDELLKVDVLLTVHHSIDVFHLPTLMHNYFIL